jgi:hypothetical protein
VAWGLSWLVEWGGPWLGGLVGCPWWVLATWFFVILYVVVWRILGALPSLKVGTFSLVLNALVLTFWPSVKKTHTHTHTHTHTIWAHELLGV